MLVRSTAEAVSAGWGRELELLCREHDEARASGRARVAFVRGPSGVGKARLLAALHQRLGMQGVCVFEGGIRGDGTYGLFADLVPELLAHLAETGVPARAVTDLARRTASLRGEGRRAGGADDARLDLADASAEIFALAGRSAPAFLLSELESADRASLDLLRYLLAAACAPGASAGGLYVLAFRDDGALPAPLSEAVSRISGLTVSLSGLDLEGMRAYLSRREVAERLLDLTGGLPTVLEQVIASAPEAHPTDLFLRRVERLPPPERDALAALAILAGEASADALGAAIARARGRCPLDLSIRLGGLVSSRLLASRHHKGEGRFGFAREADRETLLGALPADDARAFHAAWAEELALCGDAPERVARHWLAADPRGRGREAALRASEALAARLAFDDAIDLLLQALALTARGEQGPLHHRLAALHRANADYPAALRHVGLWRRTLARPEQRRAREEAARILVIMGRLSTAERLLQGVLGQGAAPRADEEASVQAYADLAEVLLMRGEYERAGALCGRGMAAFEAWPEVILGLRNTLGKVFLAQGRYEQAHAAFVQNEEMARASGPSREAAQARLNQGVVAHRRGDRRSAILHYQAALPELDRKGQAHALSNLGSLYADSGELEAAIDHLSRALSAFTRARRAKEVAHCAGNLARLHAFLGDVERAGELCEHMAQVAGEVGDPYLQASATHIGAEIAEARGEAATALDGYREAKSAFEALGSPRTAAEAALGVGRAALALGERAEARMALLAESVDRMAATTPAIAAERDLVAGELALIAGELPEASRRLSRAKEILLAEPDLEGPYRVYALLSRLRAAAGDPAGAAAEMARAARLLDELASRVPPMRRQAFARVPRRALVLAAAAEREITPVRQARALDLGLVPHRENGVPIIGQCEALQRVFKMIGPVARSNATVLIRGESGTGKELIAEAIHRGSPRRDMPLVKMNCAAMVEELLLSELFGHEKGAFTGAVRERKGRFELADGGTLFLDEIGDISLKSQVALLRVLQEREFERVGGTKTLRVDVRVVCATHRDLEEMVAHGQFRQDLYYRLKGVVLELPTLRERGDDLSLLCSHFLEKVAKERGEEPKALAPEALDLLRRYSFPGNIRELENVISSATLFAAGRVVTLEAFDHLPDLRALLAETTPAAVPSAPPVPTAANEPSAPDFFGLARSRGLSLKALRQEIETQCIARALTEAAGNISEAARLLKMKRSRLSQIVNADPQLRILAKGELPDLDADDDHED